MGLSLAQRTPAPLATVFGNRTEDNSAFLSMANEKVRLSWVIYATPLVQKNSCSAIRWRIPIARSGCASSNTPLSDVSLQPSKAAVTVLARTAGNENAGALYHRIRQAWFVAFLLRWRPGFSNHIPAMMQILKPIPPIPQAT